MNKHKFLVFIFALAVLVTSCSKNKTNDLNPEQKTDNFIQGSWSVSYFSEKGKDETSNFSGYKLFFGENGVFTFSNSQHTLPGTWSLQNQSDGSSNSNNKLVILVTGSQLADELQDDWVIIEMNEFMLSLKDDNSENNELLWLKKN